ncbi:MAG: hypothetical protein A2808_02775 [Candidatus Moranbacteria bacterium RIFCSPHIGHO2_01_FULL_55_24]|nr:MAG: hypothetical protein A2808_02775 [Candidatus Moranbacteria bacterium RIFCSPHIGHO2_01_FULL_55_24]
MQNKKLWIILGGTFLIIAAFVAWGLMEEKQARKETAVPDASIIYYYGEECPHCKVINEFLEKNDVASKVSFTKKEVWHDQENSAEMQARAESCGLDKNQIGVPFVYTDEGKCLIGEPDVKKFFSEKAGIAEEAE